MNQGKHVEKENVIARDVSTKTDLMLSDVPVTVNKIPKMKPQKKTKLSRKRKQEILPEFEKIFSIGQNACLDTTDDFQTDRKANRVKKSQNVVKDYKETVADCDTTKTLANEAAETVTKLVDSSQPASCVIEAGLSGSTVCLTKSAAVSKPTPSENDPTSEIEVEKLPNDTKCDVALPADTVHCPNCSQVVAKSEKPTHLLQCLRKKFSASGPSIDSDAELARKLQDQEDQKHRPQLSLVFCDLCQKDITHMNTVRRTQHVNKCIDASERSGVESDIAESLANESTIMDCPMCGKKLKTKVSRVKHIKQCSLQMSVAPGDLLNLLRKQSEEATLKACIEPTNHDKRRNNRRGQRKVKRGRRTIVEIPEVVYHSVMDKERLIAQRVSSEILRSGQSTDVKITPALLPSKLNDSAESLAARRAIWTECHHAPSGQSPVKKYYVESLVPPLTPACGPVNRLKSVALIPGRTLEGDADGGPSDFMGTQTALILSDLEQQTVPQGWEPTSEMDCSPSPSTETNQLVEDLSCMVNDKTLSDVIIMSDQQILHAHKFILYSRCPKLFHAIQAGDYATDFVDLCRFSKNAVLMFITYLYTAQISLDSKSVLEVLNIAKVFGVADLENVCENFSVELDLDKPQSVNSEFLDGELIDDDNESENLEANNGFHDSDIEDVFEHITLTQKIKCNETTDESSEKALYNDLYANVKRFLESSQLSQCSQTVHDLSDAQVLDKVNQTVLNPLSQTLVDHLNRSTCSTLRSGIEICVDSGDYPESETESSEVQGGRSDTDDTCVTMDTELDQVCSVVHCVDVSSCGRLDGRQASAKILGFSTPIGKSRSQEARLCLNISKTPDLFGSPVASQSCIDPDGDTSSVSLHISHTKNTPANKSSGTPDQVNLNDSTTLPPSPTFGSSQHPQTGKSCLPEHRKRKGCQSLAFSSCKRPCVVNENTSETCNLTTVYNMDDEIDLTQDSSSDESPTNSPKHASPTEERTGSCLKHSSASLDACMTSTCVPTVSSPGQNNPVINTNTHVCSPQFSKPLNTMEDADCVLVGGSNLCDPWEDFDEGGFNEDLPLCGSPSTKIGPVPLSKSAGTESDGEPGAGGSDFPGHGGPAGHRVGGQLQGAGLKPVSSLNQGSACQPDMVDYNDVFAESFHDNMGGSPAVCDGVYKTPHNPQLRKVKKCTAPSPFTPMPKYDSMVTPELKHACHNIGVKPLPKKKMITFLKDVYHQTHQYETDSEAETSFSAGGDVARTVRVTCDNLASPGCDVVTGDPPQSSEQSACSDSEDSAISGDNTCSDEIVEKTFLVPTSDDNLSVKASEDVADKVYNFLKRNQDVYMKVLTYEPLEIGALHATLKATGIRCGLQRLIEILDRKCVNYTMKDAKQPASNRQAKKNRKTVNS